MFLHYIKIDQYSKPHIRRYHYLPTGSLYALGASKSLLCSYVSFKLIWNGLHVRYIAQTDWDEIYEHAFYVCAIWDIQAFSLKNYWSFNTKSYCSDVCGYHLCSQTLVEIYRNMGICYSVRAVAARENHTWFISLGVRGMITILKEGNSLSTKKCPTGGPGMCRMKIQNVSKHVISEDRHLSPDSLFFW